MNHGLEKDNTKIIISLGFLAIFLLMVMVLTISGTAMHSANTEMSALVNKTTKKTARAYQMRDVIRLRTNAIQSLSQITDPVERERVFEKLAASTKTYIEIREELTNLVSNEREQDILNQIKQTDERIAKAYNKAGNRIFSMKDDTDAFKSVVSEVQLQELVLLNHLNDLVLLEQTQAKATLSANEQNLSATRKQLRSLLLAGFVVSILISYLVIQRVSLANKKISHLANHDDLTGLYNRRAFEEHLENTIHRAARFDTSYGLMFVDLDRFKIVNDTCGHHAGDQLLINLTQLMQDRLRKGDLFARVGGDEFAIVAQGKNFSEITQLAEDLRKIVEGYKFQYTDQTFSVSLSIGLVPIDGQITDKESIVSDVDSACYVAKQSGRNRVHVSQQNDSEVVKYRNDIAGVQSIRQALAENRLVLYHQPVYRITSTGVEPAYCEILLRIISESGTLYSPAEFIPLAEKYNIMTEIDRWVVAHVLEWMASHKSAIGKTPLLVNLSGLSFVNENFMDFVVEGLQNSDIDPKNISFEITETAAVDNLEKARLFIDRVRALGSSIALDDFGSGFSTFAYLKHLPIDYLKIDGSLVKNMKNDTIDKELVRAINEIGHTVGAKTIAEFVEDTETIDILRALKVDFAQGYGLKKPTPLSDMVPDDDDGNREEKLDLRRAS